MTQSTLKFLALSLLFNLLQTVAMAADLQRGLEAYQRQDHAAALAQLVPLARQGNPEAQFYLGVMYDDGDGLTQDYGQAFSWFRKAAEQGHAQAQRQLGKLYFHGLGVEKNLVRAYAWFNLAMAQGDNRFGLGRNSLKMVQAEMSTAELKEAQNLSRLFRERYGKPTTTLAASTPPPAPTPVSISPPPRASSGGFRIQLASLSSQAQAGAETQRLQRRHAALLGNLEFSIQSARLDRGTFHRIQVGPLSHAQANSLCETLKRQNQPCLVIGR